MTVYRDIDLSFRKHPVNGDIITKHDIRAVLQAIRNLVFTSAGELLMQPDIHGDVNSLLFKTNDPFVRLSLQERITETIQLYEPRVELSSVVVTSDPNNLHALSCKIVFYILNQANPIEDVIALTRYR